MAKQQHQQQATISTSKNNENTKKKTHFEATALIHTFTAFDLFILLVH
jgi:hypothetical protein